MNGKHKSKEQLLIELEEMRQRVVEVEQAQKERELSVKALREEKEYFEKIVDTSNAIIVGLDKNHKIRLFNKGAGKITGYEAQEVVGKDWFKLFFADEIATEMDKVWEGAWGTTFHAYINPIKIKNGDERLISWQTTGVYESADDEKHVMLSIGEDITEREQAEQGLKESEKRYKSIFHNYHAVMLLIDPLNGKIVDVNHSALKYYGYSYDEITSMKISDINILSASEVQKEMDSAKKELRNHFRFRHKLSDGVICDVEVFSGPIMIEERELLYSIIHDTTERRQAEKELVHSHNQLESIFRVAPTGVGVVIDRRIQFVNDRFIEMLGYTREELVGQLSRMVYPSDAEFERVGKYKYEQIQEKGTGTIETVFRKKDGSLIDVLLSSTPLDLQDLSKGVTFTALDITERLRAEEALAHSHDLMRYIIEHNQSAVAVHDRELKYVYVSQRYLQDYKVKEHDVIGKHHYDVFPDLPQKWRDVHQRALAGEVLSAEDDPYLREDGTTDWTRWECRPWYEADGSIGGIIVYTEIITERKRAEEALRESEFLLNATQQLTKVGGWNWNVENQTMFWTDETYRIHEIDPTETEIGSSGHIERSAKCYDEKDRQIILGAFQKCAEEGISYDLEIPFTTVKGNRLWVRTTAQAKKKKGKIVGVIGNIMDITKRKKAEEKLRESERKFRLLAEHTYDWEYWKSPEGGYIYLSSSCEETTGYSPEEFIDNPKLLFDLVTPDDVEKVRRHYYDERHQATPNFFMEFSIHDRNGKKHWLAHNCTPVFDEQGKFLGRRGNNRDITERKQAEVVLKESEDKYRALYENAPLAYQSLDEDGCFRDVNPTWLKTLGYQQEEVIGKSFGDFLHPDWKSHFKKNFSEFKERGYVHDVQYKLRHRDDHYLDVSFEGCVGYAPSGNFQTYCVFKDITEQIKAEQAIQQYISRLDSLHKIDQAITGSLDLKTTLNILLSHLLTQLDVDAAAVLCYEKSLLSLNFSQGQGFRTTSLEDTNLRLGEGLAGEAALQRREIFIPDLNRTETSFSKSPKFKEEEFVAYYGISLIAKGVLVGVLEIFQRSALAPKGEWLDYLQTLAGQAAIAIDNDALYNDLRCSNEELALAYDATIEGWARALELRDMETEGHSRRVVDLTIELAHKMGVGDEEMANIYRGALLHDIGKMGVPDSILQKSEKLTEEEWQIMHKHPVYAYEWLSAIDYLRPALDIPYCHHEKWDGSGYPRGLQGEQIPLSARIFAIVDVWDALRSDRFYRKAWSKEKTLANIQAGSGKHFDPNLVGIFIALIRSKEK